MNTKDKYFELCYTRRIHEFSKIDLYMIDRDRNWTIGEARVRFASVDEFYLIELGINKEALSALRSEFSEYNNLYLRYHNADRHELFKDPAQLINWYRHQNDCCNYCGISQSELLEIVEKRNGNLTLNQKTKRSRGTLEIEKLNPSEGYTFSNSVLACPFCNNAKSNLISEDDWRGFFVPVIQQYFKKLLSE